MFVLHNYKNIDTLLSTFIIMACILLQQCSQYIVLHPAVAQFVTQLCIDI